MSRVHLVVPCYNEAKRLQLQPWLQFVAANREVRLVFVNDGSTDDTAGVLAELASGGGTRISVLTLPANGGKARAVQQGVLAALTEDPQFIGYWDADLSTPLNEFQALFNVLLLQPEVEIAMGARVKMLGRRIERGEFRHYLGRFFATAASIALGVAVYDTQCGAKLFRLNDAVRQVFTAPFQSTWAMDVEILSRYLATLGQGGRAEAGTRIHEVPLQEWRDVPGSKLRVGASLRALMDLFRIWRGR